MARDAIPDILAAWQRVDRAAASDCVRDPSRPGRRGLALSRPGQRGSYRPPLLIDPRPMQICILVSRFRSSYHCAAYSCNELRNRRDTSKSIYARVPISKFVSLHGILVYELRNRKDDTGKSMILVWLLVQKSAYELAAAMMRSSESPPLPSWHRYATGAVLAALMKLARARESLYCSQPQNETPKWPTRSRKF